MPVEKKRLALRAMRNARNSLKICLGGKGVSDLWWPVEGLVNWAESLSITKSFAMGPTTPVSSMRAKDRWNVDALDICVAFAGSFLVRIARLFPEELDLKNVARDVEALAKLLSGCEPNFIFML
jgi:hypothetical protein